MQRSDSPLVSVVIPAYNMSTFLADAIDSVLDGEHENVEAIVVDDGSRDRTPEVLQRYTDPNQPRYDPRVRAFRRANAGKSAAVNWAVEQSRGSFITVLDADDRLTPGSIRSRLEVMDDTTDVAVGPFAVFDGEEVFGTRPPPRTTDLETLRQVFYLSWRVPFGLSACLLRRSLVNRIGGYDTTLRRCVDGDYALRMLKEAQGIAVVENPVLLYRKYRQSRRERIRYRLRTAIDRPKVIWRNYDGWRRFMGIPLGLTMDALKGTYELLDNYKS